MHDGEFDPARAERLIDNLRIENRRLKDRLLASERLSEQELPERWHKKFAEIRRQNAKYRTERNEARAELATVSAELEALRGVE